MVELKLPHGTWQLDEGAPLGRAGGFGQVFAGTDSTGVALAVKRLFLDSASVGHRELDIANALIGRTLAHVIPVADAGVDAESGRIYVVMARAVKSLRDEITSRGRFNEPDTISVLEHIAMGLAEVDDLVHRDLKPDNVLLHEGAWKVADFGIARFAEEATSPHTLKDALTPHYAAPEQWRGEHATHATDIYALGCIAYELLTGTPPFNGTSQEELMRQHLADSPPQVEASGALRLLVATCLRKPPAARPTIAGFLERLRAVNAESGRGGAAIVAAAAAVEQAEAERHAKRLKQEQTARERQDLAEAGRQALDAVMEELFGRINSASRGQAREEGRSPSRRDSVRRCIRLGRGVLCYWVEYPQIDPPAFSGSKLDIAAGAVIAVRQEGHPMYDGRGANLWYGDLERTGSFAWWEQAYMTNAFIPSTRRDEPFGVDGPEGLFQADRAHSMIAAIQRASRLRCIEGDGLEAFCERWMERLSSAATCSMSLPTSMPDEPVN